MGYAIRQAEENMRKIYYIINENYHYWDGQGWTPVEWEAKTYLNPWAAMNALRLNKNFKKYRKKIREKSKYLQLELFFF
jgi:hypothetical protein